METSNRVSSEKEILETIVQLIQKDDKTTLNDYLNLCGNAGTFFSLELSNIISDTIWIKKDFKDVFILNHYTQEIAVIEYIKINVNVNSNLRQNPNEYIYRCLAKACQDNMIRLASFIINNFNISYQKFQEKDKVLDKLYHNGNFSVYNLFLRKSTISEKVYIHYFDKITLTRDNQVGLEIFFDSYPEEQRRYLYMILMIACKNKYKLLLTKITNTFIFDLNYHPGTLLNYYQIADDTNLNNILREYEQNLEDLKQVLSVLFD